MDTDVKKCRYCGKEISYDKMYCSDQCEKEANKFFEYRAKTQSGFSALNGIFVLGIGISIFVYSFSRTIGAVGGSICLMILGLLYNFFPFPAEIMIEKYKLKKAVFITKIISGILFALGVLVLLFFFFGWI